jgi:hypothetical protein
MVAGVHNHGAATQHVHPDGTVHNHDDGHDHGAPAGQQPAPPQDTFQRAQGPNAIGAAPDPENNAYVKWVKANLPNAEYAKHLNGEDGKPSVQRAYNVYAFMNFYANTLGEHGIDLKKDQNAWKDMTWHTLHAFMDEAKTFSGNISFDFLGRRLTLQGEGTEKPTEAQVKKFMGHFYHISGHVTNRPDVKAGLEKPEVKAQLQAWGIDPQKPGNLIYWGNGGKVAGLGLGDSGYDPKIAPLKLNDRGYKPQIAPLQLGDAGYDPQIAPFDPNQYARDNWSFGCGNNYWGANDPWSNQIINSYFQQMIWSWMMNMFWRSPYLA